VRITVLGCSGRLTPDGASPGFLIDDQLLVDGGSIGSVLPAVALERVRWLLLSHAHMDHVKEIPMFALAKHDSGTDPFEIAAFEKTIQAMKDHIFNGEIWPDFSQIGNPPPFSYRRLEPGTSESFGPYLVTALQMNHVVDCAGFVIESSGKGLAYASDTGPTEAIWEQIAQTKTVTTVILDISMPDRLAGKADATGHLTPATAATELKKIARPVKVLAMHAQPVHVDEIAADLKKAKIDAELIKAGETYII
jgi:ribonuclease BN (tRNA processing enzyme)